MVWVTRFDGTRVMINAELIETLECTPDTVLTLTTGRKMLVAESVEEVASRVLSYRREAYARMASSRARRRRTAPFQKECS